MSVLALKSCGWLVAHLPVPLVRALAWSVGLLVYTFAPWRMRIAHSNLHHAFPDRPRAWRRGVARRSCQRLVEMTLFALASPFFNRQRIRDSFTIPQEFRDAVAREHDQGHGSVFLIPHLTLAEVCAMSPVIDPLFHGTTAVFRPLNQGKVNAWVKRSRERWGCRMLSRKEDLGQVHSTLAKGGKVSLLFDQNAGGAGLLFPFFDRLASATHLPGLLVKRHDAAPFLTFTKRTGFWQVRVEWKLLDRNLSAEELTFASHDALAEYLSESMDQCADWLWLHNRRKNAHTHFKRRFHLNSRKLRLAEYLAHHQHSEPNQGVRYWFRLPRDGSELAALKPHLQSIAQARPDAELSLLGSHEDLRPTETWSFVHKRLRIPNTPIATCRFILQGRKAFPDLYVCLSDHPNDAKLGWLLCIPQRFGWQTGHWTDRCHTHTSGRVPKDKAPWCSFFARFGQ